MKATSSEKSCKTLLDSPFTHTRYKNRVRGREGVVDDSYLSCFLHILETAVSPTLRVGVRVSFQLTIFM